VGEGVYVGERGVVVVVGLGVSPRYDTGGRAYVRPLLNPNELSPFNWMGPLPSIIIPFWSLSAPDSPTRALANARKKRERMGVIL